MSRTLGSKDKKPRSIETRAHMAKSKLGAQNGRWRGDAVGYRAAHSRVRRIRGTASDRFCKCGKIAYEWANLTSHYTDINDYEPMCRKCHRQYDKTRKDKD